MSFAGPIQHNNNKELFLDSRVESEAQEIEKERQPERRQEPLNDTEKGVSAQEPGNTLRVLCCAVLDQRKNNSLPNDTTPQAS